MSRKLLFLISAVLVAVDQLTKILTRTLIPMGEKLTVLPGVVGLTYIQNTGAAFSFFSNGTLLLAVISLAVSVGLAVVLWKNTLTHPAGQLILAVLLAGAVGNLIDRALLGYVTDMIDTLFMDFAVYNFADICVVLGAIAMAVYVIFFYDRLEKKESDHGAADRSC